MNYDPKDENSVLCFINSREIETLTATKDMMQYVEACENLVATTESYSVRLGAHQRLIKCWYHSQRLALDVSFHELEERMQKEFLALKETPVKINIPKKDFETIKSYRQARDFLKFLKHSLEMYGFPNVDAHSLNNLLQTYEAFWFNQPNT